MSGALHALLAWFLGLGGETWLLLAAIVLLALAIALLAWLLLATNTPDDQALAQAHASAMPYDSMYVQNADVERRRV